jgi:NAD(P)-dependent dehydrogenase (short-subunit alcohol dehydrogenase family)
MAGMHLPGTDCLLHAMRLRFISPIVPPLALRVDGEVLHESSEGGSVAIVITDRSSGRRLVEAGYDYGFHRQRDASGIGAPKPIPAGTAGDRVLVTGATGGLGGALVRALGSRALPVSRSGDDRSAGLRGSDWLVTELADHCLSAIVHCGWPPPDNTALTRLTDVPAAVEHHVAAPLADCIALAQLLKRHGSGGATLVLVGSTAALPGRHAWRKPLYSIAKAMIPTLAQILTLELAGAKQRCTALVFDALDGGMNSGMSASARVAHADRSPFGLVPSMEDAARQVLWLLDNPSPLASGAVVTLSGGALP